MTYARQLEPNFLIVLIVDQFNESAASDEGWNANTNDDIEPANLWGFGAVEAVRQQIEVYRHQLERR
jgi:hypothetical protein